MKRKESINPETNKNEKFHNSYEVIRDFFSTNLIHRMFSQNVMIILTNGANRIDGKVFNSFFHTKFNQKTYFFGS